MAEHVHNTPTPAPGVTRVTTTAHLGRRTIAGGGLLALLGSSATLAKRAGAAPFTPAPNPDAALLALGAALDVADAKQIAWDRDNPHGSDDEYDAVRAPCHDLVHQIEHLEAHTIEGLIVKARAISWCNAGEEIDPDRFNPYPGATTDARIAASIVRDLLRRV